MIIKIAYSSKWSVQLMNELKEQKVLSLATLGLGDKTKELILDENDNYESIMKKLSLKYPNFSYKTITQSTVLGVLARLLGEIRYLDIALKEENHPINKIKDKLSFVVNDRTLYNEIVSLYKPLSDVQSNGGGLVYKDKNDYLLFSKNIWSEILYSLFNLKSLEQINGFIQYAKTVNTPENLYDYFKKNNIEYKKTIEIHNFIFEHAEHSKIMDSIDKNYVKEKKDRLKNNQLAFTNETQYYHNILTDIGIYVNKNIDENNEFNSYSKLGNNNDKNAASVINIIGLLYYFVIEWINKNNYRSDIEGLLINNNNNIPGIASNSGKMTIKDMYGAVSPKKETYTMPYMLDTKMIKKKTAPQINQSNTNIGVGKECGILEIKIDISTEKAQEIKDTIDAVGVATFQLGKKGLAYIEEINIYE